MSKNLWSYKEVVRLYEVDEGFLRILETEEIVCPACEDNSSRKMFSASELEKLRIAKMLVEDLDVNLPGVEVILRMRQNMIEMRKQFDAILEDMAALVQEAMGRNE